MLILTFCDGCLENLSYDFGCMLSIGTIHFEDRFCASKKGGNVGGSALQLLKLVAAVGCRKALVSTVLVINFFSFPAQTCMENASLILKGSIFGTVGRFQLRSRGVFSGWRDLTIEFVLSDVVEVVHIQEQLKEALSQVSRNMGQRRSL